jgi:hypothetical protein
MTRCEELREKLVKITRQRDRLSGLVDAAESSSPDSECSRAEIAHRKRVKQAQDEVFGSREELRELLETATKALEWYADQPNGERAKIAIDFVAVGLLPRDRR